MRQPVIAHARFWMAVKKVVRRPIPMEHALPAFLLHTILIQRHRVAYSWSLTIAGEWMLVIVHSVLMRTSKTPVIVQSEPPTVLTSITRNGSVPIVTHQWYCINQAYSATIQLFLIHVWSFPPQPNAPNASLGIIMTLLIIPAKWTTIINCNLNYSQFITISTVQYNRIE